MKKQITAIALAGVIVCGLLAGCGQQPAESAGASAAKPASVSTAAATTNEVNVWAWDTNYNIPIIELAGDYYAKSGHENFKVNVTEMSNDDTKAKMTAAFTSGTAEGLPDIVLIEDYDAQSFLQNYEGKFLDLTDYIDFKEFAPYKVAAVTYKDRTYAVPFDSGVAGMYYRKDYLEQAGYTAADMQNLTWTQFIQIGKDVKEKTGKWMISILPYRSTHYINMAMQSAGLWYFDESGNINLKNNPAVREMCGVLKEINAAGIANPVEYYSAEA
ncbi:MAG: ABC transporter substrate-binding protein, partial [Ruthenibacterium sp.]